ncbi:hypothetical protein [Marinobacter sp. SS5-14b]|uniref:hypothetical protein n=1 Tax=Marinobacter sp. SS5-14b TaxID=3050456 RepID=UPI0026DF8AEE|nr:hypothetical protein [Marinobacter sp. SS5-14b]
MIQKHTASVSTLPSSILHNGVEMRSQYTRAAVKQGIQFISRKLRIANRKAAAVAQDLPQVQGGV